MTEGTQKPIVREVAVPPLTVLRLRNPSEEDIQRIGALIGAALPTTPNCVTDGAVRLIWMGHDEWLIFGATASAGAIEAAATDARRALCVSVGDGHCIFEVTGPAAADLLVKGTSLDLDRALSAPDRSAMTLFAQANAIIDQPPGLDGYRLIFDVSLRDYLHHWFDDALVEFG